MTPPNWAINAETAGSYVHARYLINAVLSQLSALTFKEQDPQRRDELVAAFLAEAQIRDHLSPFDSEEVTRILAEYPARIRRQSTP